MKSLIIFMVSVLSIDVFAMEDDGQRTNDYVDSREKSVDYNDQNAKKFIFVEERWGKKPKTKTLKRKNAKKACSYCQKRHLGCDDKPICDQCLRHNLKCHRDLLKDQSGEAGLSSTDDHFPRPRPVSQHTSDDVNNFVAKLEKDNLRYLGHFMVFKDESQNSESDQSNNFPYRFFLIRGGQLLEAKMPTTSPSQLRTYECTRVPDDGRNWQGHDFTTQRRQSMDTNILSFNRVYSYQNVQNQPTNYEPYDFRGDAQNFEVNNGGYYQDHQYQRNFTNQNYNSFHGYPDTQYPSTNYEPYDYRGDVAPNPHYLKVHNGRYYEYYGCQPVPYTAGQHYINDHTREYREPNYSLESQERFYYFNN